MVITFSPIYPYDKYVTPDSNITLTGADDGSALCIIKIAQGEVGYQGGEDDYSKYGIWYANTPNAPWCVIFVSWCAHYADIPTTVIPKMEGTGNILEFFEDRDQFLPSASRNGTIPPQAGDIIFFVGTEATTSHVGIVTSVSGNTINIIDGNWGDKVCARPVSADSASIYGYGRPDYPTNSHSSSTWITNTSQHWKTCENCNATFGAAAHYSSTWITNSTYHWKTCGSCNALFGRTTHSSTTWITNSSEHWKNCNSCSKTFNKSTHSSTGWITTPIKHWKTCETCSTTFSSASHSFTVDPLTGDQYCTVCRCGQGSVINRFTNKPIQLD